ncbi:hypothetical protein V1506DRAFT_556159 [Lipomyces tetrasporus]
MAADPDYTRTPNLEQRATVVTSQRALHEGAAARLRTEIFNSVWKYLSIHKPDETSRIVDTWVYHHEEHLWQVFQELKRSRWFIHIAYEDIDDIDLELARMGQSVAKARRRNLEQGAYGPMEHRNHRWFGKLEDAFVEIWRADIKRPFRTVLIENGPRKVTRIFVGSCMGCCGIPESDVRLDLDRCLQSLLSSVEMTAVQRFVDFIVFS